MPKRKQQNNSHLLASGLGVAILLVVVTILFVQNPSIKNTKQFADDSENGGGEGAAAGVSPAVSSPSGAVAPVMPNGAMITPATTYCLGVPCPSGMVTPPPGGAGATTTTAVPGIPTGTNLTTVQQIVSQIQALFNQLLTLLGLPGGTPMTTTGATGTTVTAPGGGTIPMMSPVLTPGAGATTAQPSGAAGGDSGEGSSSD